MTDTELLGAIDANPEVAALVLVGRDADAADLLSASLPPAVVQHFANERELFATLGSDAAESVLSRLKAASESPGSPPYLARVLAWLKPSEGGLDVGNAQVRAQLDGMAMGGLLSPAEAAAMKSLAERPAVVTAEDVSRAMLPRRPFGRLQP